MRDAVKLARDCVDRWDEINTPGADVAITLARAVIAQDEELTKLRAALGEALHEWDSWMPGSHDAERIAELRRLVG